jgi:exonuclease I
MMVLPVMVISKNSELPEPDIDSLADLSLDFTDSRLEPLLIRYKAKNYPRSLNADES